MVMLLIFTYVILLGSFAFVDAESLYGPIVACSFVLLQLNCNIVIGFSHIYLRWAC